MASKATIPTRAKSGILRRNVPNLDSVLLTTTKSRARTGKPPKSPVPTRTQTTGLICPIVEDRAGSTTPWL
jgi:hypothetical protein